MTTQPRERFATHGAATLEGRELVAILLGSGIQGSSVFSISKKVNKLLEQQGASIDASSLRNIKGIGPTKAMQIASAFELTKRYFMHESPRIESTGEVLTHVQEYRTKKQEYLLCLTLDGANRLIQKRVITIGLLNQSLVHPREVFADAIQDRANSIILVHNHPSGSTQPSQADINITGKLKDVAELVGIRLTDHIIITKDSYYSFKEDYRL